MCGCDGTHLCLPHKLAYWRESGHRLVSPQATPNRRNHLPPKVTSNANAWERGVAKDSRGMPLLCADGSPMGVKEYAEKRTEVEEVRRRAHNAPATPN